MEGQPERVLGTVRKWCTGKYVDTQLTGEERKAQLVTLTNFPCVNILNVADNAELGRNAQQLTII